LLAKVAARKRVIPEIYQRYLKPSERLLTLPQNTYGRKAGGRVWRMAEPSTRTPHRTAASDGQNKNIEAAWWHILRKNDDTLPRECQRQHTRWRRGFKSPHRRHADKAAEDVCMNTRRGCSKSRRA
jgi:hypothetical protein